MAHLEEPLDGGLVTSQDPTTLDAGELVQAKNGFYSLKNSHIELAPGFTEYVANDVAFNGTYVGMAGCYMPHNNTNYLVVQRSDGVVSTANIEQTSDVLATAASSSATSVLSFQCVPYNNKWFTFNGKENKVLTASGTGIGFRRHGLTPVSNDLGTITTAGSAFSSTATGYYEYWYTEVAKYNDGKDVVESTYAAPKASTVYITSTTTQAPVVTFPRPTNANETTHYRLYRSSSTKTASADSLYPDGVFIADVDIPVATATALATYTDGGTPANVTGSFGTADSYTYSGWATASGALVTGGSEAVFTYSTAWGGANDTGLRAGEGWGMMLYAPTTAMATAITGAIAGVKLDIKMKASTPEKYQVTCYIGKRTTDTVLGESVHKLIPLPPRVAYPDGISAPDLTSAGIAKRFGAYPSKSVVMSGISTTYSTASLGSQFDDWLPSDYDWTASDFSGDFAALIVITPKVRTGTGVPANGSTITIDGAQLTVYQGGKDGEIGSVYDVITVELGGTAANSGSHGEPPTASCGTIYEGSLVTNNVAKPGLIQYSMPGFPDYFPALYQIQLPPSPGTREITYIGVVNNRLIVCTNTSMYRINYLPNEDDASFSRGRAIDVLSGNYGALAPHTGVNITRDGGVEELVVLDSSGVVGTDGFIVRLLSTEINWRDGVFRPVFFEPSADSVMLVNFPEWQTLRVFLKYFITNEDYAGYYGASYAAQHTPNKLVKWFGPVEVTETDTGSITAATVVATTNGNHRLYVATYDATAGTSILAEADIGTAQPLPSGNKLQVKTRVIPLAGIGNEANVDGIYVRGTTYNGVSQFLEATNSPAVSLTATQFYANREADTSYVATAASTPNCKLTYIPTGGINCGGLQLAVEHTATGPQALIGFVFTGSSFGEEEAG